METYVIDRTKKEITVSDPLKGKLIQRAALDAVLLETSQQFFALINDICLDANLTSTVPIIPSTSIEKKKTAFIEEKLIPRVTCIAITKQLDDAKRELEASLKDSRSSRKIHHLKKTRGKVHLSYRCLLKQHEPFIESLYATISISKHVENDRRQHILAIETSRNKKIFHRKTEYLTTVI